MKITQTLSDEAVLQELGQRIAQHRIDRQLTQAQLASESGLGKRTVERMEAGEPSQLPSLIRVLRVLDLLDGLNRLLPERGPRPLDLLRLKGKERRRASGSRRKARRIDEGWSWGEDR